MFIHTRFTWLSIISASALFLFSFVSIAQNLARMYEKKGWKAFSIKSFSVQKWVKNTDMVMLGLGIIIFLLPIRPLSVGIAQQRQSDFNNVQTTTEDLASLYKRTNTAEFTLKEWAILLNDNPANEELVGRKISVSGFIFNDGSQKQDLFYISRFRVVCCVVDASPLGIPVEAQWRDRFSENGWVLVKGTLQLIEIHGVNRLAIIPEEIQEIDVPNNPYIY